MSNYFADLSSSQCHPQSDLDEAKLNCVCHLWKTCPRKENCNQYLYKYHSVPRFQAFVSIGSFWIFYIRTLYVQDIYDIQHQRFYTWIPGSCLQHWQHQTDNYPIHALSQTPRSLLCSLIYQENTDKLTCSLNTPRGNCSDRPEIIQPRYGWLTTKLCLCFPSKWESSN